MGDPTRSTRLNTALRFMGTRKPLHHDKVTVPREGMEDWQICALICWQDRSVCVCVCLCMAPLKVIKDLCQSYPVKREDWTGVSKDWELCVS